MIAITGGGTGGHLSIAKALGAELKNRGIKAIFIGSTHGQDRAWFENSDLFEKAYFLQSSGVVNKKGLAKLNSLLNIFKLAFLSLKIFKTHGVTKVISVGGYSSAPASFGAILGRKELFIHEQNALTGKLNKLLKPFAKKFYSSYEKPKFDYPVNSVFFDTARVRESVKTIIFLGGSQGASFINSLATKLAPKLVNLGYEIIHQCGEKEFEKILQIYKEQNLSDKITLVGFCANLHELVAKADLCVGRSGASTLWELCANGIPAIFIPFPYAAGDHQFYNAKFLQEQGLCAIVRQNEADEEKILNLIQNYAVKQISENLRHTIDKNGAKTIIDDVLKD